MTKLLLAAILVGIPWTTTIAQTEAEPIEDSIDAIKETEGIESLENTTEPNRGDITGEVNVTEETDATAVEVGPTSSLISPDTGVDYSNLQKYLGNNDWRQANDETLSVILAATNRSAQGWVPSQNLQKLACWDIKIIDDLWTQHSDQHFGWSVQLPIFLETGNKPGRLVNDKAYIDFGKSIGWYQAEIDRETGNNWVVFKENMTYALSAPLGHLPRPMNQYELNGSRLEYTTLAKRLVECQVVPAPADSPFSLPSDEFRFNGY